MKNKKRIDTYNTVYDIDYIVANQYITLEDLKEDYIYSDDVELDNQILECYATTSTIRNKHTGAYCVLVKFNKYTSRKDMDKLLDLINTSSHEAVHVILDIYKACNVKIQYDNPEPVCYELANIVTNITKTLLNK